jgi:hypothetical protein
MTIELTPEQSQALQGLPDGPVGVVDPVSRREYVLVRREQYDRPRQPESASPPKPSPPLRPVPRVPQWLADLPTPPEVSEEARRQYDQWRKKWGWGGESLAEIEQGFKLQYYYGGRMICYLRNKEGPEIVIVSNGDAEEFHRQYRALPDEQRKRAVIRGVRVWMDDVTEIPSAFYYP